MSLESGLYILKITGEKMQEKKKKREMTSGREKEKTVGLWGRFS